MKKLPLLCSVAATILAAIGFGVWFYLKNADKGEMTEAAANAVVGAAEAYKKWNVDRQPHKIVIGALIMTGRPASAGKPAPISVEVDVEGKETLYEVCRIVPRLRDAITMTFTGRLARHPELSDYEDPLGKAFRERADGHTIKRVRVMQAGKGFRFIEGCS